MELICPTHGPYDVSLEKCPFCDYRVHTEKKDLVALLLDIGNGQSFPIGKGITRLGSSPKNQILLPRIKTIAFHCHATIDSDGSNLLLRSYSLPDKTLVNGKPVQTPVQLSDGDLIELDDVVTFKVVSLTFSTFSMGG